MAEKHDYVDRHGHGQSLKSWQFENLTQDPATPFEGQMWRTGGELRYFDGTRVRSLTTSVFWEGVSANFGSSQVELAYDATTGKLATKTIAPGAVHEVVVTFTYLDGGTGRLDQMALTGAIPASISATKKFDYNADGKLAGWTYS